MELRAYIQIIFKNLQLIVIFTLISLTLTLLFTTQQTPIYESASTYVTRVSQEGQGFDATIYAIDTITGRQRIYVTFCDVMESGRIREDAFARLGLDITDPVYEDYVVECTVLPESNVMVLTVEGTNPQTVQLLNQMIGVVGMEYNNTLFGYVEINLLDNVWFNPEPISPNYLFNGVLGLALGVAVSLTIVFLLDYLRSPAERMAEASIYEVRLNVYNSRYARRRLGEEIERSKMQNRLLAIALIELSPEEGTELEELGVSPDLLLRQAVMRMREKLRTTDILAHRENNVFTLIMPETPERTALRLVRTVHEHVASKPIEAEGVIANFVAVTGMVENNGGMYDTDRITNLAVQALDTARRAGPNTIEFIRTKPSAFVMDGSEIESLSFNVDENMRDLTTDDTQIPPNLEGIADDNPVVGGKTQPIFFNPDNNPFADPQPGSGKPTSALDRVVRRTQNQSDETSTRTDDDDTTRIGPFAVKKKRDKDPDDTDNLGG